MPAKLITSVRTGAFALLLLALSAPVAASDPVDLRVGGVTVRMPVEAGYVAVSPRVPELRRIAEASLPPSNRLVEYFHTEKNLAALLRGANAEGHFMMVQTARELEPVTFNDAKWREAQPLITEGMASWDPNSIRDDDPDRSRRMSEAAGHEVAMNFGKIERPTIYRQGGDSVRFLMKLPVVVSVEGETRAELEVGAAAAIARVKGKILFLYWYAIPATPESIDSARRKLDKTIAELERLNRASPGAAGE